MRQPRTAEIVSASLTAVVATALFVVLRIEGDRWAGTLPGLLLGATGIALMLYAALGYSARKRNVQAGALSMQRAMTRHVVAGLLGPYLVILHSGLAFNGLAAVLSLLMVLVVASGVIGRAAIGAAPRDAGVADPVRVALLDAQMARVEADLATLLREPVADAARETPLRRELTSLRHQQQVLRQQWQVNSGPARRVLSVWWLLHVPVSMALWALAAAHITAALYFALFAR